MTALLQKALSEVQKLSADEQDAIAAVILEELEDERRWDEAFESSQQQLSKLAAQAEDEIAAGRIKRAGIDEL
jgi:aspartate/glutamate racemase